MLLLGVYGGGGGGFDGEAVISNLVSTQLLPICSWSKEMPKRPSKDLAET